MFYCPKCRCKLTLSITVVDIPADYSVNILTSAINLALCGLGNFAKMNVDGFRCPNCSKFYLKEATYLKSQITSKYDFVNNFVIVSIKNKKDERIDGKVTLVIPPKIIHKDEVEMFNNEYNPYKDAKYLIINPVNQIDFITPK